MLTIWKLGLPTWLYEEKKSVDVGATYLENHVKVVWPLLISEFEVIVCMIKCICLGYFLGA